MGCIQATISSHNFLSSGLMCTVFIPMFRQAQFDMDADMFGITYLEHAVATMLIFALSAPIYTYNDSMYIF